MLPLIVTVGLLLVLGYLAGVYLVWIGLRWVLRRWR